MTFEETGRGSSPIGSPDSSTALSEKSIRSLLAGCFLVLFGFLFLSSAGASVFLLFPAYKNFAARSWTEVPCIVTASEVVRDSSSGSPTYSLHIAYEYEVNGKTYRSSRYDFAGWTSSGYSAKAAIVDHNPPGTRKVCYVNPSDPTDAVMNRSFGGEYWVAVIPLAFLAITLAGMIFVLRAFRKKASSPFAIDTQQR